MTDQVANIKKYIHLFKNEPYQVTFSLYSEKIVPADFKLFDLVILYFEDFDIGIELCQSIRPYISRPIISLSAFAGNSSIIQGLESGADDYLLQSIPDLELLLRIKNHLKREIRSNQPLKSIIRFKHIEINTQQCTLKIKDRTIKLTKTQFQVLYLLASYTQKVFTQKDIYYFIHPQNSNAMISNVRDFIYQIRKKFEPFGIDPIKTHPHFGYSWRYA